MKQTIPIYIVLLILLLLASCSTTRQRHLTERLFLQPGRINIAHYYGNEATGQRVLSEQVSYSTEVNAEVDEAEQTPAKLDTSHVYAIPSITVVSKAKFAPIREGHVSIDFVINIPKEFLSDDYQISLIPELLHNDSLVMLEDVVLRGKHFIEKQEQDYERYNEYVSTIIDPAGYDTAFINRHAVEKELHRRRKNELSSYYTRWSQYQDFIKWQNEEQEKYDAYNIKQAGKLKKKLRNHDLSYRQSVSRLLATGQDTTVLGEKYRRQRKAIIASAPAYRQITAGTIPGKYQDLYLTGLQAGDIEPVMPEEEDSLRIASEHIMHERIAFNEIKGSRLEETFNRMVPAPYRPEAHYNAVIAPEYNFTYRYTRSYPVTPGLKKLRLTLKGSIMATDRSNYNIRRTDTLSYIISSMDELADTRLIANQSFTDDQRREYTNAIRLLKNREYRQALHLLNNYKDYNTALALTCLGYNSQAYNLLRQLPKTADTHYLNAIVCQRLQREEEAVKHFREACKLDEEKWFRADRDREVSELVRKFQLRASSVEN